MLTFQSHCAPTISGNIDSMLKNTHLCYIYRRTKPFPTETLKAESPAHASLANNSIVSTDE